MTYPPSGSFGQQPDPYGQQQPDPYTSGFPQVQYGGLGGGEPPKKNNSAIIATIVVVVVLLAGVGVTGFVAPGFFLSDDKNDKKQTGGGSSTSKDSGDADLEAFAEDLLKAANDQDKSTLRDLTCSDASSDLDNLIDSIDAAENFKLEDVGKPSGGEADLEGTFEVDGDELTFTATVAKDGGDWCWKGVDGDFDDMLTTTEDTTTEDTTETQGPDQGGAAFVDQFLATMAAGDAATAATMVCPDSSDGPEIAEKTPAMPILTYDPSLADVGDGNISMDLTGTMSGVSVTGYIAAFDEPEHPGWCVYVFSIYN